MGVFEVSEVSEVSVFEVSEVSEVSEVILHTHAIHNTTKDINAEAMETPNARASVCSG